MHFNEIETLRIKLLLAFGSHHCGTLRRALVLPLSICGVACEQLRLRTCRRTYLGLAPAKGTYVQGGSGRPNLLFLPPFPPEEIRRTLGSTTTDSVSFSLLKIPFLGRLTPQKSQMDRPCRVQLLSWCVVLFRMVLHK